VRLGRRRLEAGQERSQAPQAGEVVRPDHALDELGLDRQEVAAAGNASVVREQVHLRMPLEHARRDALDRLAVRDVADLVLAVEFLRQPAQPVLAAGKQHAAPSVLCESSSERRADPARRAGDDRYLQTRTLRDVRASRPAASRTTAVSVCRPFFALTVRHVDA
jgi:hypothetical protein